MFSDKASLYVSRLGAGARIRKRSAGISRDSSLARSTAISHSESISVNMDASVPSGANRPRSADCQSTGNATLPSSGSLVMGKSDSGSSHVSTPISVVSTALSDRGPPSVLSVACPEPQGMSLREPSDVFRPGQGATTGIDVPSMQGRSDRFLAGGATAGLSLSQPNAGLPPFALNPSSVPHGNGTFVPTPRGAFSAWDGSAFAQPPPGMGASTFQFAVPSGNLNMVGHPNQALQCQLQAQQQQIASLSASVTQLIGQTNLLINTRQQAPAETSLPPRNRDALSAVSMTPSRSSSPAPRELFGSDDEYDGSECPPDTRASAQDKPDDLQSSSIDAADQVSPEEGVSTEPHASTSKEASAAQSSETGPASPSELPFSMAEAMAALRASAPHCVTQTLIEGTQSSTSKKLGLASADPVSSLALTESETVAAKHAECLGLVQAQGRDSPARKEGELPLFPFALNKGTLLKAKKADLHQPLGFGFRAVPGATPDLSQDDQLLLGSADTAKLNVQLSYTQLKDIEEMARLGLESASMADNFFSGVLNSILPAAPAVTQQLRALNKAMEATVASLARIHVNLALVRRDTVLSASKMVRDRHNVKSLRSQPLRDDSLFAGQVASFVAKEASDAKAFRDATQAVKRKAPGSHLAKSHSEAKKTKPSPAPAHAKGQGHPPRQGNKGKKPFLAKGNQSKTPQ